MEIQETKPLYFLGPKSENRPFFKEIIDLLMNDYVFWRRNFHPQDPTAISFKETQSNENQEFKQRFTDELFKLLAELKLDPPFFSPRYMAHMISETALPGLIAYISTLMYNPNNVSSESSPITLKFEIIVGKQLATLFGFNPETSFGHIASGGTLANYESLFYNMGIRFIPLSFLMTLKDNKVQDSFFEFEELLNFPYENYPILIERYKSICLKNKINHLDYEKMTLGYLGLRSFEKSVKTVLGEILPDILIIIPSTGHYSWSRGVKLMGLGRESLLKIPMNQDFQMDTIILEKYLIQAKKEKKLIIQLVGVYGTTEFGSFDAIHELVRIKEKYQQDLYFPIHVDAAYGGYYSTLFHEAPENVALNFYQRLKMKHLGIAKCDSVTVDPHKLGYAPYGAGGFIFKHGDLKEFIAENAEYCFNPKTLDAPVELEVGKYILEGSKPGASAAAVYFNHKMIPLNYAGHGKIIENLSKIAYNFYRSLLIENENDRIKLVPICPPQSNIVCFFIQSPTIKTLSESNSITAKLAARFGVKKIESIQEYDYIVSNTTYNLDNSSINPFSLNSLEIDCSSLTLIRMVFMNQFHEKTNSKGESFIKGFIKKAKEVLKDEYNLT